MSTSELNKLKNAQYHLDELEKMISENKWYSHLYQHIAAVEGELQRQVNILENLPKAKTEDIKDTEKLYDVLENQTTGYFLPDTSYSSLTRVGAAQKYEELLSSGVSPNDIKIKRVK
tara:strand:+ start:746 stop:1096 length:351 start_codon:yes stop_codon:yes gene_type:complete